MKKLTFSGSFVLTLVLMTFLSNAQVITVNPASVIQQVAPGCTVRCQLNIANTGDADLTFEIIIEYLSVADTKPVRMAHSMSPESVESATYSNGGDPIGDPVVNSSSWLTATPMMGTFTPGENTNITLDFNAVDLELGSHSAILHIENNSATAIIAIPIKVIVNRGPESTLIITPGSFDQTLYPDQTEVQQMTITNLGAQALTFDIEVVASERAFSTPCTKGHERLLERIQKDGLAGRINGEVAPGFVPGPISYTDDPYDLQFEFPCAGDFSETGVECDGNYIYTSVWTNAGLFLRYQLDGNLVGEFTIPGVEGGVRDLAYDGLYMYGSAANTSLYEMDFENEILINTISVAVSTRAIAYDEIEDGFWANNWSTNPTLYDRTGAYLNSFNISGDESFYGFAYFLSNSGVFLWGNSQSGSGNTIKKYNLPDGTWIEDFDMMSILSIPVSGDLAGGLFTHPHIEPGYLTLGGLVQDACIWGIFMDWLPFDNDVQVLSILKPTSGFNLTQMEPITIIIKNTGINSQSEIPYSISWEDGFYDGVLMETLETGDTAQITLPITADLSAHGDYTFEACTNLDGDENPMNDCKIKVVTNSIPIYCDASTSIENEYISNVNCGDINKSSDWQGLVANYTDITTTLGPGESETITVLNGNAWPEDNVYAWIDWNNDAEFGLDDGEEVRLTNIGGTGESFTGTITAPIDAIPGPHRMRIRMTSGTSPNPCGSSNYGEVEDYTIITGDDCWLSADPLTGTLNQGESMTIEVTFDSDELEPGDYSGSLVITSNDLYNPVVNVDATLHVISPFVPVIAVDPPSFWFEIHPGGTESDILTVENDGTATLNYIMEIEYVSDQVNVVGKRPDVDPANCDISKGFVLGEIMYSDDPYDLQFEFACADATGEAGAETDGNYIYTTKWNSLGYFFKYELDGTFAEEFAISGVAGIRDLAFDGTYMYGGAANTTLFEMDFNNEILVSTISVVVATRAIAYDEGNDGFWANNWSTDPTLYNRFGIYMDSFSINGDESFYGFAYMNNNEGIALWGYAQSGSGNRLMRYNLPDGTFESEFDMMSVLSMPISGDLAGGLFMHPDMLSGRWTLGGIVQDVCVWGIEMGYTQLPPTGWLTIEPTAGSVVPGASEEHDIVADAANFVWYEMHEAIIVITSNDPNTPELEIPVTIGIINNIDDGTTQYFMMYPNPASNGFSIKSDYVFNCVKVFNQSGQLILEREVNSRQISFSTSDLPIGIYFVEITSDYGQVTQKLIVR